MEGWSWRCGGSSSIRLVWKQGSLALLFAIAPAASAQTTPTNLTSRPHAVRPTRRTAPLALVAAAGVGAGVAFFRPVVVHGERAAGGGAVAPPGLHVAADVFVTDAVTAGASVRYQIVADDFPWLLQARLAYWLQDGLGSLGPRLRYYARVRPLESTPRETPGVARNRGESRTCGRGTASTRS